MSNVGAGNATVALANGVYTISFSTAESAKLAPTGAVTANASGLTGSTHSAVVSTGTNGALILNMGTTNPAVTVDGNGGAVVNLGTNSPTVTSTAANLTLNATTGSTGNPVLIVNGGNTTLAANTGLGIRQVNFANIVVGAGAKLNVASSAQHVNRSALVLGGLQLTANANGTGAIIGTMDLNDNDAVLRNGGSNGEILIGKLVANAYDNGGWDLPGIKSTAAANSLNGSADFTDVGYGQALDFVEYGDGTGGTVLFDGVANYNSADDYVKYTYAADGTLDGKVDSTDYAIVDAFNPTPSGGLWAFGDYDHNGAVGNSDYAVLDGNVWAGTHSHGDTAQTL